MGKRKVASNSSHEDAIRWLKFYARRKKFLFSGSPRDSQSIWRKVGEKVYGVNNLKHALRIYVAFKGNRQNLKVWILNSHI